MPRNDDVLITREDIIQGSLRADEYMENLWQWFADFGTVDGDTEEAPPVRHDPLARHHGIEATRSELTFLSAILSDDHSFISLTINDLREEDTTK